MASSSNSWMPMQGRHQVNIGSSLAKTLKARKLNGAAPATNKKRSALPERDFYALRYNFKPTMIDANKPGSIEVKKGKDSTSVLVEHPSTQPGENHIFRGTEHPGKEHDCLLIYDEETGTFTLEKLDSYMNLTYERKTASSARQPSPVVTPSASQDATHDMEIDDLDRDLLELTADADADGEADDDLGELLKEVIAQREEEEEGEEEEIPIPPKPPSPKPPPPAKAKPQPKPARVTKPLTKPRVAEQPAPKPAVVPAPTPVPAPAPAPQATIKVKPAQSKAKKPKKEPEPVVVLSDPDEEHLEFGVPAQPARPPPQPSKSSGSSGGGLALPGSTSAFAPPPPPVGYKPSASTRTAPVLSPPPASVASESEEEWDEVEPNGSTQLNPMAIDEGEIFGDDPGEEIDVTAFERELNQQMEMTEQMEEVESDEDFLEAAIFTPEPETPLVTGQPISLNQLAGGGDASEDDYSSSDDSDDD